MISLLFDFNISLSKTKLLSLENWRNFLEENNDKEKVRNFILEQVRTIHKSKTKDEIKGGSFSDGNNANFKEEFAEECKLALKEGFSITSQTFDIIVKEMLKENKKFTFDVNVFSVATTVFVSPPPLHFIKPFYHSNHFVVLHFFNDIYFLYDSIPFYCVDERKKCVRDLVEDKEIRVINTGPQGNNDCAFFALSTIAKLVEFPIPLFTNSFSRRKFFIDIAQKVDLESDPFLSPDITQTTETKNNTVDTHYFVQPKRKNKPKEKQKTITKRDIQSFCKTIKLGTMIKIEFFKEDKETWVGLLMQKGKTTEVFFIYELCDTCGFFRNMEQEIRLPLPLPFSVIYFSISSFSNFSLCDCDDNDLNLLDMEEIEKEIRNKNQDKIPDRFIEEKEQIKENISLSISPPASSLNGNVGRKWFIILALLMCIN